MELSIKEAIAFIYKRLKFILLLTFVGVSILFIINRFIRSPIYTATVQLYVNSGETASTEDLNELNYAQKVVATCINFLRTQVFYRQVLEETDLDYSEGQLGSMTQIQSVDNTEIFRISVTSQSASDAFRLVEAMQKIAPVLIENIKENTRISVVDPVVFPGGPSGPNILFNTMIGGIVGSLLALGLSLLWELIDVNVKNKEELMKKYQIPILGIIPNFDGVVEKKRQLLQKIPLKRKSKKTFQTEPTINQETNFVITEAYKSLRTNLRYTLRNNGCKKILINSPTPEDGKSTTCTHIGITIAQTGARVLLMDCDLRKGKLHKTFNLKSSPGISDLLSGMKTEKEVIQNSIYENLQVITIGSIPPNPTELLSSLQMEEFIKSIEKNYDYIILDSPPVNLVSDALSLAKLVDGVLLVVKENSTTHPNIETALNKYELVDARILGFVLNGISLSQGMKSKSNYYYYQNSDD